jgi:hypothetical protein
MDKSIENVDNSKMDCQQSIQVLKLAFLKNFHSNPYPFFSNEPHRIKTFAELDITLGNLIARVKNNIQIFLDDLAYVAKNGKADVGTLLYFIKSQHGASRWEKMADELTFQEHAKLKQEWVDALEENRQLKAISQSLTARDQPEWVQKAIDEYQKLIKKYETETRPSEKDMLRNQVLTMQKRFGFG